MKYIKDEITGSYYSMQNGELIQNPMNVDGTADWDSPASVDWDYVATELPLPVDGKEIDLYRHLKKIEKRLQTALDKDR